MVNRRDFLGIASAGILGTVHADAQEEPLAGQTESAEQTESGSVQTKPVKQRKLAILTTEWRFRSHGMHMGDRFLVGYPKEGVWHEPDLEVAAVYVDQFPDNDLSRARSKEFGFPIYPTISETLRCGGKELAVDAVLIIGEHGNYPKSELDQTKYPRYEFFKQVTEVFRQDGKSVPIFNDKHLSWNFEWAQEMVKVSKELKFPFLAGSSLPLTWRLPALEMPMGAEIEEILCLAIGSVDSYDFHALETIQCLAERRKGGETGVAWLQALRGAPVWDLFSRKSFESGGLDLELFEACLARTQTLTQPPTFSHRKPTFDQIREWVKEPVVYRYQHRDGLKVTMLLFNGLVQDFTVAARIKGRAKNEIFSTLFYLPSGDNVAYSANLMARAEEMFVTRVAPYPIERTLLTTGLVEAGCRSLHQSQAQLNTPQLHVEYQVSSKSLFANR